MFNSNTIGAVACISSLRSPMAKARAWIRQVLNAGALEESLTFIIAQTNLLRSFYYPNALLCTSEECKILVSAHYHCVSLLSHLSFADDGHVNDCFAV